MAKFKPGDVAYHKATNKKCVIIKIENEGEYLVRTEDNLKEIYFKVELETIEERKARFRIPKQKAVLY